MLKMKLNHLKKRKEFKYEKKNNILSKGTEDFICPSLF